MLSRSEEVCRIVNNLKRPSEVHIHRLLRVFHPIPVVQIHARIVDQRSHTAFVTLVCQSLDAFRITDVQPWITNFDVLALSREAQIFAFARCGEEAKRT